MSTERIEGFDLIGSNQDLLNKGWTVASGNISTAGGIDSGRAYIMSSGTEVLSKTLPFIPFVTTSFWWRTDSIGNLEGKIMGIQGSDYVTSDINASTHLQLAVLNDGSLEARSVWGIQATSAPNLLTIGQWHHIEVELMVASVGHIRVFIDGISILDTGGNFKYNDDYSTTTIYGGCTNVTIDDVVIQTHELSQPHVIGGHKIATLLPNGDTAVADFTGSYTDVDDPFGSSDGDATFITANLLGSKSEFTTDDIITTIGEIFSVQTVAEVRKDGVGIVGITPYISSGGVREDGLEIPPSPIYLSHTNIFELNPNGGIPWDLAAVNALQIGVEITT